MIEAALVRRKAIQSSAKCAYPQIPADVLNKRPDVIVRNGERVRARMAVHEELIRVKLVEAVLGAEPEKSLTVLHDRIDGRLREALCRSVCPEEPVATVGKTWRHPPYKEAAQEIRQQDAEPGSAPAAVEQQSGCLDSYEGECTKVSTAQGIVKGQEGACSAHGRFHTPHPAPYSFSRLTVAEPLQ